MTAEVSSISYEKHWTALMTTVYADIEEGNETGDDKDDWNKLSEAQKDLLTYGDRPNYDWMDCLDYDEEKEKEKDNFVNSHIDGSFI